MGPASPARDLIAAEALGSSSPLTPPTQHKSDDATRRLGLALANIAIETGGVALGHHPTVVAVVKDELCRALLLNSQAPPERLEILSLTLRAIYNLFMSLLHLFMAFGGDE